MRLEKKRRAIAMIELIFAIVIMGIVMMSAPQLISTAANSTVVGLQQEGINEAASRLNMILTYAWDQNDTSDSCIPPVLHVTAGDSELEGNTTTERRIGVDKNSNSHTFLCGSLELNASALGVDGSDDIDDFTGTINLTVESSGSGGTDYNEKTTVQMATAVNYIDDNASYTPSSSNRTFNYNPGSIVSSGTSNIKEIVVTLTSSSTASELNKTIILRGFSCNIGGFEYEGKVMP